MKQENPAKFIMMMLQLIGNMCFLPDPELIDSI